MGTIWGRPDWADGHNSSTIKPRNRQKISSQFSVELHQFMGIFFLQFSILVCIKLEDFKPSWFFSLRKLKMFFPWSAVDSEQETATRKLWLEADIISRARHSTMNILIFHVLLVRRKTKAPRRKSFLFLSLASSTSHHIEARRHEVNIRSMVLAAIPFSA